MRREEGRCPYSALLFSRSLHVGESRLNDFAVRYPDKLALRLGYRVKRLLSQSVGHEHFIRVDHGRFFPRLHRIGQVEHEGPLLGPGDRTKPADRFRIIPLHLGPDDLSQHPIGDTQPFVVAVEVIGGLAKHERNSLGLCGVDGSNAEDLAVLADEELDIIGVAQLTGRDSVELHGSFRYPGLSGTEAIASGSDDTEIGSREIHSSRLRHYGGSLASFFICLLVENPDFGSHQCRL